jgi:predicted SprT family Zn-dependent metalloprotease
MKIPAKFQLMGRSITVCEDKTLNQEHNWDGAADYCRDIISLLPVNEIIVHSRAKREQTFCHELAHFLLYFSGAAVNHDLKSGGYIHNNEEFVDLLGSLLHQALESFVFVE